MDLGVAAFDGVNIQLWFSPIGWNTTDTSNTSFTNFICQVNVNGNGTNQNQIWTLFTSYGSTNLTSNALNTSTIIKAGTNTTAANIWRNATN